MANYLKLFLLFSTTVFFFQCSPSSPNLPELENKYDINSILYSAWTGENLETGNLIYLDFDETLGFSEMDTINNGYIYSTSTLRYTIKDSFCFFFN